MTSRIKDCVWLPLTGFLLLMIALESESYRILMVPTPSKSHVYCLKAVAEELVARGHHVHFVYRDDFSQKEFQSANSERFKLVLYHGKIPDFMPPNATYDDLVDALVRMSIDKASVHALMNIAKELLEVECRQLLLNSEASIKPL